VAHDGARLGGEGEEPALGVHLGAVGPHGGDLRGQVRGGVDVNVDLAVGTPNGSGPPCSATAKGLAPCGGVVDSCRAAACRALCGTTAARTRCTVHAVPSSGVGARVGRGIDSGQGDLVGADVIGMAVAAVLVVGDHDLAYQQRPERFDYHLTDKGRGLTPVIAHLLWWGDRYYPEPAGPPRLLRHRDCGGPVEPRFFCGDCQTELTAGNIAAQPGPGLSAHSLTRDHDTTSRSSAAVSLSLTPPA